MPDVVKTAINNCVPSEGYYLAKVTHRSPGITIFWGVRLDTKPVDEWDFVMNKRRNAAVVNVPYKRETSER